jgi:hypothetical protein
MLSAIAVARPLAEHDRPPAGGTDTLGAAHSLPQAWQRQRARERGGEKNGGDVRVEHGELD